MDADVQPAVFKAHGADAVLHGVFHQRLQDDAGHFVVQQILVHLIGLLSQLRPVDPALDAHIQPHMLQFLGNGGDDPAVIKGQTVKPREGVEQVAGIQVGSGDGPPVEIGEGVIQEMRIDLGLQRLNLGVPAGYGFLI